MGTVYEASHLRVRRRFAIKALSPNVASDHEALTRFQREALVTSELGHPHIIEVIDFNYLPSGTPYIVMELLEGEDLEQRLDFINHLEVKMSLRDVAAILHQTASALHAAHKRGIIHRDMKPSNIFLCNRTGQPAYVKVLDFGISKVLGTQNELTCAERIMGTPYYMAPEQAEGRASEVDPRTDIFSLGSILYTMIAGHQPFTGDSIPEVLYKVAREDPQPLVAIRAEIPKEVSDVVAKALSKNPSHRQASMNDLWREFADAAAQGAGEQIGEQEAKAYHPTADVPALCVDVSDRTGGKLTVDVPARSDGYQTEKLPRIADHEIWVPQRRGILIAVALLLILGSAGVSVWISSQDESSSKAATGESSPTARHPKQTRNEARGGKEDPSTPPLPASRLLWVTSIPAGAEVWSKGRLLGRTPVKGEMITRLETTVELKLAGRRAWRRAIRAGDKPVRLLARLSKALRTNYRAVKYAQLKVGTLSQGKPLWADVYLDGKKRGQSPLLLRKVRAGSHVVEIRRAGFQGISRRIYLRPGQRRTLLLNLKR
jgi:serine/threonine-protein kinase